jgi:predicted O-methyltransferase YrrM
MRTRGSSRAHRTGPKSIRMNRLLKGIANFFPSSGSPSPVDEKGGDGVWTGTLQCVPPGHFYSPIPSLSEVSEDAQRIFQIPAGLPGIDLNKEEQLRLFDSFKEFYQEIPFKPDSTEGLRYYYENANYGYSDAICLYSMMRHFRPKRIIEIGSGHSSCVMLDTSELFFNDSVSFTFIEPDTYLLMSLLKEGDRERFTLIPSRCQDADPDIFSSLSENDMLFIDSTHVSKVGSDVNYLLFEVLPRLQSGVLVHFHDIFYPFEYPKPWICELGIYWNESYLLRAFLQYNDAFRIVFFNTYLEHFYREQFAESMPLCLKNPGGSLWIRKL